MNNKNLSQIQSTKIKLSKIVGPSLHLGSLLDQKNQFSNLNTVKKGIQSRNKASKTMKEMQHQHFSQINSKNYLNAYKNV